MVTELDWRECGAAERARLRAELPVEPDSAHARGLLAGDSPRLRVYAYGELADQRLLLVMPRLGRGPMVLTHSAAASPTQQDEQAFAGAGALLAPHAPGTIAGPEALMRCLESGWRPDVAYTAEAIPLIVARFPFMSELLPPLTASTRAARPSDLGALVLLYRRAGYRLTVTPGAAFSVLRRALQNDIVVVALDDRGRVCGAFAGRRPVGRTAVLDLLAVTPGQRGHYRWFDLVARLFEVGTPSYPDVDMAVWLHASTNHARDDIAPLLATVEHRRWRMLVRSVAAGSPTARAVRRGGWYAERLAAQAYDAARGPGAAR